jgi:pimeloyl-ACP methyl ester carboxylesterase
MRPLLRAAGHEIFTPTYTGLGERVHQAGPDVDLDLHIRDVLGVLECEDLRDVLLIGHSYGGMVASGVADRARERIARLIYLDAFVPNDGQSVLDLVSPETRAARQNRKPGEWTILPSPPPPDTSPADVAWTTPRRFPQPAKTFEQAIKLTGKAAPPPRAYIYCKRARPDDGFRPFAERAKREGWDYFELDASHNPHITAPNDLLEVLLRLAR